MSIFVQDYVETAERIDCPAPLPEGPAYALLMEMLVPAPYKAPEKKAEKKAPGTRKGLRCKVVPDASSEDDEAHSSPEGEEDEDGDALSREHGGLRMRARGPRRVPGARPSYPRRPIPPAEAGGNTKKLCLPALGRRRRGKPPQRGRPGRPRRERPPFRITPPRPPIAKRSGCPGGSP